MKTRFMSTALSAVVGVAGALLLAGCPAQDTTENTTPRTPGGTVASNNATSAATPSTTGTNGMHTFGPNDDLQLAFVTNNSSDFWTIARKGVEKADRDLPHATVQFRLPSTGTAQEQQTIIDNLLVTGVNGIAISPKDPANQTDMLNSAAAKALVVTQDSDAPRSNRSFYVGTDNRAAGRQAGEAIKRALPNGGKIMLFVGSVDAQNAHDRQAGIEDVLRGTNITIIETRTDDTDRLKAKNNAATALVRYPDISCLVGLWSYNGPAILNAVREAHKTGKVKIVCFDEEDETLGGVRSGDIIGTVVQNPYEFGRQSVTLMDHYLRGNRTGIPASKQIFVPTRFITRANVAQFSAELAQLRK